MKQRLSEYAKENWTPGSRPSRITLRKMCERGDIPGAFKDSVGYWWVELGDTRATQASEEMQRLLDSDPLIQELFGT